MAESSRYRTAALMDLLIAVAEQVPNASLNRLRRRIIAAMDGDRSDRMLETMATQIADADLSAIPTLAAKLVREYEP